MEWLRRGGKGNRLHRSFITKSLLGFERPVHSLPYVLKVFEKYLQMNTEWVKPQRTFNIPILSSPTISLTRLQPSIMDKASVESQRGSHGYMYMGVWKWTKASPLHFTVMASLSEWFLCVCEGTHVWGDMYAWMYIPVEARGKLKCCSSEAIHLYFFESGSPLSLELPVSRFPEL